ncbi:S1 RNA-binding domain-containing protein [Saccharopolyspora hirsuta]|uniref:S1 RNA-binding domain-containing protein n=1 Tax=Saccharopolyspora hirsuta TaxID=1837 RepID=A0A5M7C731_SACHI|nr:S1 RNA-binding domain-containing protein [Saccharopolyspora hirsuta]KAA5838116.1 S1 RNA-binding domain-containing protein [Saccharopolyspora hirsuta]
MSSPEVSPAAWQAFQDEHGVGSVVEATVVSVVPFGAFVEVAPGIHGLMHEDSWDRTPQVGESLPVRIAEWGPPRLSVAPAG